MKAPHILPVLVFLGCASGAAESVQYVPTGSYGYSIAPGRNSGFGDVGGRNGFNRGMLTDGRTDYHVTWVSSPIEDEPVTITFDIRHACQMRKVTIWALNEMAEDQSYSVAMSGDGRAWKPLGSTKHERGSGEKTFEFPCESDEAYRFVKLECGDGNEGKWGLAEVEIWGLPGERVEEEAQEEVEEETPAEAPAEVTVHDGPGGEFETPLGEETEVPVQGLEVTTPVVAATPEESKIDISPFKNIVQNPGFENGEDGKLPAHWQLHGKGASYVDKKNAHHGAGSLAIKTTGKPVKVFQTIPDNLKGTHYQVSFWAKTSGPQVKGEISIAGAMRGFYDEAPSHFRATEWKHYQLEFFSPPPLPEIVWRPRPLSIWVTASSDNQTGGTVWIDDIAFVGMDARMNALLDKVERTADRVLEKMEFLGFWIDDLAQAGAIENELAEQYGREMEVEIAEWENGHRAVRYHLQDLAIAGKLGELSRVDLREDGINLTNPPIKGAEFSRTARFLEKWEMKVAGKEAPARGKEEEPVDLAALYSDLRNEDATVRKEAVTAIGMLADSSDVDAVLKLLDDRDEDVRVAAIMTLAWLKAREAVPQLIRLLSDDSKWVRRRATQALGIIGDTRALDPLLGLLTDADTHVSQNAAYALGWLKDKRAVPKLCELALKGDRVGQVAAQSLGFIGDKSALPILKEGVQKQRLYWGVDMALGMLGEVGDTETIQFLKTHEMGPSAGYSIQKLEGRFSDPKGTTTPGVSQPDWFRKPRFGEFSGRIHRVQMLMAMRPSWFRPWPMSAVLRRIAKEGTSAIRIFHLGYLKTRQLLDEAHKSGLKVLIYNEPGTIQLNHLVHYYGDHPAFLGTYVEEVAPLRGDVLGFLDYLRDKYTVSQLRQYGLDKISALPGNISRAPSGPERVAWVEYKEWTNELSVEYWKEHTLFFHTLRKNSGVVVAYSVLGIYGSAWRSDSSKITKVIDSGGPEPLYNWVGNYMVAMMCDLCRDGTEVPVTLQMSSEGGSPGCCELQLGLGFAHVQMMHEWKWIYQWRRMPLHRVEYGCWWHGKQKRKATVKVYSKMARIEPYLVRAGTDLNKIAILYSERSADIFHGRYRGSHAGESAYFGNARDIYCGLTSRHVQFDTIWAETMTTQKIAKYKVMILMNTGAMTPDEIGLLREWVKAGGVLIVSGQTTICDRWGQYRRNYALSDVMGVRYRGEALEKVETTITITAKDDVLGELPVGGEISYDPGRDRDVVEVTTGKVLAKWDNGEPAIVLNTYGKGKCLFIGARYFRYLGTRRGRGYLRDRRDRFMTSIALGSLRSAGEEHPLSISNVPEGWYLETVLRTQRNPRRIMLHLASPYGPAKGVGVEMLVPTTKGLKVFYPDGGREVDYKVKGNRIAFEVQEVNLHECVVVEFE